MNMKTGEIVKADATLKQCAVREVKEELGIDVKRKDLKSLGTTYHNPNLFTIEANYVTMLEGNKLPKLNVLDQEFKGDDLDKPRWYKMAEFERKSGKVFAKGSELPLRDNTIGFLQKAVNKLPQISKQEKEQFKEIMNAPSFAKKQPGPSLGK